MIERSRSSIHYILAAAAIVAGLALLPTTWPAFSTWQPQSVVHMPADGAGQSLIPEFDGPIRMDLPVIFSPTGAATSSRLEAEITVLSAPPQKYDALPVRYDPAQARLQIPLASVGVESGTPLRLRLHDPDGRTWVGGTAHDSYPAGERLRDGQPIGGDLAFRLVYRRSLLTVVLQGVRVALASWRLALAAAVAVVAGGLLSVGLLRRVSSLDWAGWVSFILGAGILITALLGVGSALLRLRLSAAWIAPLSIMMALAGALMRRRFTRSAPSHGLSLGIFLLLVALIGSLRLTFAADLSFPPHRDAIENYAIVADLMTAAQAPVAVNQIQDLLQSYYHYGYHALAAWLLALAGGLSPKAILVLGQLLQTTVVGAVYFPVYAAVRDRWAAVSAVALTGLGWIMPAHASNWSKLPALTGLIGAAAVVGLTALAFRSSGSPRKRLFAAAGCAAPAASLVHTRMAFLLAAFLIALWMAYMGKRLARGAGSRRHALAWIAVVLMAGAVVLLSPADARHTAWGAVVKFVEGHGAATTFLVLLLAPFAMRRHSLPALTCIFWAGLIVLFQFLPPGADYPFPLLDAPLVSMALFLPLSGLGGIGVAGLVDALQSAAPVRRVRNELRVVLVLIGLSFLGWALTKQPLAADDCCLIAGRDDAAVVGRIAGLPPDARILIPGGSPPGYSVVPHDGGAWIYPLTRRQTWPIRPQIDLASPFHQDRLCAIGITHVYVGMTAGSFQRQALDLAPDFYTPRFVYPQASLYSVEGCEND